MFKKAMIDHSDANIALLNYRNTPLDGIGVSPAQLLMGRVLRSRLPITNNALKPRAVGSKVAEITARQSVQKKYFDNHARPERREYVSGNQVRYLDHKGAWRPGIIANEADNTGRSFNIVNKDNRTIRRNRNHMFKIPVKDDVINDKHYVQPEINVQGKGKIKTNAERVSRYGRTIRPIVKMNL